MAVGREKLLGYGITRCRLFPAIAFALNTALNMPGASKGAWHVFTVVPILCQPRRAAPSSDHIPLLSGRPVCATMGATYGEIRHSESTECTCNRLSGSTSPNLILTKFLGFRLYRAGSLTADFRDGCVSTEACAYKVAGQHRPRPTLTSSARDTNGLLLSNRLFDEFYHPVQLG